MSKKFYRIVESRQATTAASEDDDYLNMILKTSSLSHRHPQSRLATTSDNNEINYVIKRRNSNYFSYNDAGRISTGAAAGLIQDKYQYFSNNNHNSRLINISLIVCVCEFDYPNFGNVREAAIILLLIIIVIIIITTTTNNLIYFSQI